MNGIQESQPNVKRSDIVYKHMRDPRMLRYYYKVKTVSMMNELGIGGSSPTDIFIGRFGYPNVSIGPLVPPQFGDTSLLSTPERWRSLSIEEIVEFRSSLVRGMTISKVADVETGRIQQQVRDLALADRPAEAELSFLKKPFVNLEFRDEVQPYGPSAQIKDLSVYNTRADRNIEKYYMDDAAKAATSVIELYDKGINVSKIQRGLSAGLFGLKNNRKFVPTRWSITAVDDTISKRNRAEVKDLDVIDSIYAFSNVALDNRWLIFFIPGNWQYESIEAWWPKTIWNEDGKNISIFGSYEGYKGRSTYAEIGGCYYAARLAVTEKLKELNKQAMVLILREVHDGYTMPVGVWNVREHVRETLSTKPQAVHNTKEMLSLIAGKLDIKVNDWIRNSQLLKNLLIQKRINEYVAKE
ncbi:MAG: hypothetical protein M1504_03065 [Candidatus Marsarchaeota archaeon]|nr:hypothetical protein [Candidatus Marsarchaeota archaeon]